MGEVLEITKALISPIEKLMDIVQKGTGMLYESKYKKKMADATAYEINAIGQALRDNCDMLIGYNKGEITVNIPEFKELVNRTQYRLGYQQLTKQHNIESVIENSYAELENGTAISSEQVDSDWVNKFFNCVENVSNEDMQKLWGKILAGEIRNPGSFSRRTLEAICNLSQNEARAFQKILPLLFCSGKENFISSSNDIINKYNVNYEDILLLDECGLMVSSGTLSLNSTLPPNGEKIIYNKKKMIKLTGITDGNNKISINIFSLTKVGKELLTILEYEPNVDYIDSVADEIYKNNKSIIDVSVYNVNYIDGCQINYQDEPMRRLREESNL